MLRKLLIITCLSSIVFVAYADRKKKSKNDEAKQEETEGSGFDYKAVGTPLAPLKVVTQTGKQITNKDVENDANLFVMLFNPTCEHCQQEAILFRDSIHLFKKNNIVCVATPNMMSYMDFFEETTRVSKAPKIIVGVDSSDFVANCFSYNGLPQINIYNKDRILIKQFVKDTPIDSLKKYID